MCMPKASPAQACPAQLSPAQPSPAQPSPRSLILMRVGNVGLNQYRLRSCLGLGSPVQRSSIQPSTAQ